MHTRNTVIRGLCGLLLAFLFVLSQGSPARLYATGDVIETGTVFTVGSASGRAGERVTIPVYVEDCAPFFAMGLKIHYDDQALEILNIRLHEESKPQHIASLDLPRDLSKGILNFVGYGSGNVRFEDGPFLMLTFRIRTETLPGNYEIGLSVSNAKWVNLELQILSGSFIPGNVQVTENPDLNIYPVTFEGGTGSTGTPPRLADQAEGASFRLPDNLFRREGYIFNSWHDGIRDYEPGSSYTMPGQAVIFTAQWEEKPAASNTITTVTDPPVATGTTVSSPESISHETTAGRNKQGLELIFDSVDKMEREIRVEEREEGLVVKGKDLSGLTFEVDKSDGKVQVNLDTEEKEVLIKDKGKDGVEVFIDADGDGFFETSIGRSALKGNKVLPIVILVVIVLIALLVGFLIFQRSRSVRRDKSQ